jgi:hypothetical protein
MSSMKTSPSMLLVKQLVFIFRIIGNTLCDNTQSNLMSLQMVMLIVIPRF